MPIALNKAKKIAVVGENAIKMMTVGGGSSSLKVKYEISPLDGLKARAGSQAEIVYARGYVGDPTGEYNGVKTGQDLKMTARKMNFSLRLCKWLRMRITSSSSVG